MSKLRIKDAPLLQDVDGTEKIPTGGRGDLAISMEQVKTFAQGGLPQQIEDHINDTENPHQVNKSQVGLGEVDNTSDVDKPISTATQAALDLKADKTAVHSKSLTLPTYYTKEAGVNPVTGVADSAYFNVRSEDDDTVAIEYQNVGGSATATGNSYPSSSALEVQKYVTGIFDLNGKTQENINNGLSSIAEMLAIRNPKNGSRFLIVGYHAGSLLGGGEFIYSKTSTLAADQGIVFDCPDGGKWIRLHNGEISYYDYGAKGDGISDDTLYVERSFMNPYCRDIVTHFGTFLLTRPFTKTLERTSIWMGDNARFKINESSILTTFPSVNSSVFTANHYCRFKINLDGPNKAGLRAINADIEVLKAVEVYDCDIKDVHFAVRFYGGDGCVVRNNRFTSLRQSGVLFTVKRGCSVLRNKVYSNHFEDLGDTAFAVSSDPDATREDEAAYNVIFGNTAKNTQTFTDGVAFDFETGYNEYKHHNIFANNTVEQTAPNGKRRGGLTMINSDYSAVIGNTVKGAGLSGASSRGATAYGGKGVIVQGNAISGMSIGIDASSSSNTLINGNTLIDCGETSQTYPAISVTNAIGAFKDVTLSNNIIVWTDLSETQVVGIAVQAAVGLPNPDKIGSGLTISNNLFKGGKGRALYLLGSVDNLIEDVTIKSNKVDLKNSLAYNPIYFRYCKDVKVIDNDIKDAISALAFENCDSIRVMRNVVSNNLSSSNPRYFQLGSEAGRRSTNIIIEDNDFVSDIPTPITASDKAISTLIVRNNRGAGVLTANKGVATNISTGTAVIHGLAFPPTFIDLTASVPGLTESYISDITATTFKINFTGATAASFMWRVEA